MIHDLVDGMSMTLAERLLRQHGVPAPYSVQRLHAAVLARGWGWETVGSAEGLWVAVTTPDPEQEGERLAIGYVQVRHLSIPAALTQALALALRDRRGV